ncbi:S8 family serine peptidase [Massilia sp.]|uniref:S8 family serine peptidase n=1 Tax=Massilia sp. TaxID=1882437 RepID=UPI00352FD6A9
MDAVLAERVKGLQERLREKRILNEPKYSDAVIVWPSNSADAASSEVQMLSAIDARPSEALADLAAASVLPRTRQLRMQVLNRLDDALVMKANSPALLALRNHSPGLRIAPSAWAYLQFIRPLGDDLAQTTVEVAPGAKARQFQVRLADSNGTPVAGARSKAVLDLDSGANVAAVTGTDGIAALSVPVLYPRVELIVAEPEHTYWSLFTEGFDRVEAPKKLDLVVQPLLPDTFNLRRSYARYDAGAGAGVTVGVIDCGVGPHQAIDVAGGRCLVTGEDSNDFRDNGIGHGTHVAGLIAAKADPGGTVYGMAPACRLMAYRVCPKSGERGRARSADIAAGLQQAIDDGCDIVNISMGSLEAMPEVPDLLEKARAAGIVVFAATGNDGKAELRYPGRYSHTMSVGALGRDATFPDNCPETFQESEIRRGQEFVAEFSNYGIGTDFIGPGVAVLSTFPGDKYAMMSGTSMASPFIAGMAARILAQRPDILAMARSAERADALVQALSAAARKVGFPPEYEGFGVLMEK